MTTAVRDMPRVRPATSADLDDVGALTVHAYVADGLVDPDHWYADELRAAARRAAETTLLVAVVPSPDAPAGERVVGTLTLAAPGSSFAEIARPGELELRMLAVDPAARRSGVARDLVVAALREAVGRGVRQVVLSTLDTMHAAHALYASLGFTAQPDRDWTDEATMRVHAWHAPQAPGALVESATWPPPRVVDVDGWRVGLSGGVTRRAGSTIALSDVPDLAAAVDRVEALYRDEGTVPVFRVGDPGNPAGLAAELDARGYGRVTLTDVLVRDVSPASGVGTDAPGGLVVRVADHPDDVWLDAWLAGKGGPRGPSHAVVTGAPARYLTATDPDGTVVAVIRAAPVDDWVALSCLQVAPGARRRGVGRALTEHALRVAADEGARRAFLQVEADNLAALRLYTGLGFAPAHRYVYREPASGCAATGC